MAHYERLSALDAAFLEIESSSHHMHGGAQLIFDAGPLRSDDGGIDFAQIRDLVVDKVQRLPHYRQRIDRIPMQRQPVWVDDERFDIDYHLRHVALPRPGTDMQLKQLVARIVSQPLDHSRALWEMWIVEGLEGDRFALVGKVHHCIMDGITGIGVMQRLLRNDPNDPSDPNDPNDPNNPNDPNDPGEPSDQVSPPIDWKPRPAPGPGEMLADEIKRGTNRMRALFKGLRQMYEDPQHATDTLMSAAHDAAAALGTGLAPASPTPLNPRQIGPHRRVDWLRLDLQTARGIRAVLGGTVNDVVLATMTGGLRRFFEQHGVDLGTLNFRVLVPVSRHGRAEKDGDQRRNQRRNHRNRRREGNRVSFMLVHLPLGEADPAARYAKVLQETHQTKRSGQDRAAGRISDFGDWLAPVLVGQGIRLISLLRPYNMVISNVPGPTEPLYLLGCRMREIHPIIPLYLGQALGIALFSYDGSLFCGITADWDVVPEEELSLLSTSIRDSFEELSTIAQAQGAP